MFTHTLHTDLHIAASPAVVWAVLTDSSRYADWNPFIPRLDGALEEGARLKVRIEPPGGQGMTFTPTVREVQPRRTLAWLGRLLVPGLFDGAHRFELHPEAGGTRFVQRETFRGLLVPLFRKSLEAHTRSGFEAMNAALKAEAERRSVG